MFFRMLFGLISSLIEVIVVIVLFIIADIYFGLGITDMIITMIIDYVKQQIVPW